MKTRMYTGEADLRLLQDFNARAIAVTDHCGYLHPGDIPLHIYAGNRAYDPTEILTIWEDDQGVAAWLLIDPSHKAYDAQVHPDVRGGDLEREMLTYADERLVACMRRYNVQSDCIYADAFRDDTARSDLLTALGWVPDDGLPYVLNRTEIKLSGVPALPEGYAFRSARGIEDAAALAAVHRGAFGASWTAESYGRFMESSAYASERELVIEAPDGTFVAFTIIWYDHLNRMGLFEPVGTHRDYQRRGFGRALMMYAMRQMADAGMAFASVAHFGDNEAAKGLYWACGFRPWYLLDGYVKPIPS